MGVRAATAADDAELRLLLTGLHHESVYRVLSLSEPKLAQFLRDVRGRDDHVSLVYEGTDGTLDGCYIGQVSAHFFSNDLSAYDLIFYVRPERRGGIIAYRLWQAFRAWAKQRGARTIWPGVSTGIDPARAARFYRGLDLVEVGSVFFARL